MKTMKLATLGLLFATTGAFAQTQVDLTGGTSVSVKAGEDVYVNCTAATNPASKCAVQKFSNDNYWSVFQDGKQLSAWQNSLTSAVETLKMLKEAEICQ